VKDCKKQSSASTGSTSEIESQYENGCSKRALLDKSQLGSCDKVERGEVADALEKEIVSIFTEKT
jgi:hypothetical protein